MTNEIAENLRSIPLIIRSSDELGNYHLANGEFERAFDFFRKALDFALKDGNSEQIFDALTSLGDCHYKSADLFMAIECFQNARETAEKSGNVYLKTLAELRLIDLSLTMGNYALADDILTAIENDPIYKEDELLGLQVNLRRVDLAQELGDKDLCRTGAESILKSPAIRVSPELGLQAETAILTSRPDNTAPDRQRDLDKAAMKAVEFDNTGLAVKIKLLAGEFCQDIGDYRMASSYYREVLGDPAAPRGAKLEAAISRAALPESQDGCVDNDLESLVEMESVSAGSGFLPLALRAVENLGDYYLKRGRVDLYEECQLRAEGYQVKILSALPKGYPADRYRRRLVMKRIPESTEFSPGNKIPEYKNRQTSIYVSS